MRKTHWQQGFSLIELMIAVVIIGILASIAYPSYEQYVRKARRAAAQAEMMSIASKEQEFFLANRMYADKTTLEGAGYSLSGDVSSYYSYAITTSDGPPPSFTITFTATGKQSADGNLSLTSAGVKEPAGKW